MTVNKLPDVGRIQGLSRTAGFDVPKIVVSLQYTDRSNGWHELEMPFLDAMYLLNCLRAIQQDVGYAMPDDPFAPKT